MRLTQQTLMYILRKVLTQALQRNKCRLIENTLGVSVKLKRELQSEVTDNFNKFQ